MNATEKANRAIAASKDAEMKRNEAQRDADETLAYLERDAQEKRRKAYSAVAKTPEAIAAKKAREEKHATDEKKARKEKKSRSPKPYYARNLTTTCYGKETKHIDECKPAFVKWYDQPITHAAARAAYEMSREAFRTADKLDVSADFKLALRKNAYTLLRKALTIQTQVNSEIGKAKRTEKNLKTPEQIKVEIEKALKRAGDLKLRLALALKSA
jgi:hypothetical protein